MHQFTKHHSFTLALTLGISTLFYSALFSHPAYATFSASISRSGIVNIAEAGSSTIRPTSIGTLGTGSDVVTVTTNCTAGYNLYVSATSTGGTNLNRSGASSTELMDSSNYIPTSSTAIGAETTLARDTWGVGKTASAFAGLQDYAIDISELTPFYTGNATSDYTFYYGVNVSTAKTPGTYTGEVLYTVLMNSACISYTLNFDDNGATTSTLTPQELNFGDTIDLANISDSSKIAKTGYSLTGWQDQDGNTYGITGEVNVNPDNKGTVTLTAIWEEDDDTPTMQAWAASNGCNTLATNQYLTLKDARDDNKYVVKKLADGKCWMVENLRLVGERKLTSADSDVSSDFNLTASTAAGWCMTDDSECNDQALVYYNPSEASDSAKSSYYGALYNWYTATAGTGTYSLSSGNASSSICPSGWRLPTGGVNGDFATLDRAWGGTGENRYSADTYSIFIGVYSSNNNGNFGFGGYIASSIHYVGSIGLYWSSTTSGSSGAYNLDLHSINGTRVYPQGDYNKFRGFSVRCVTRETTMQETSADNLAESTTTALKDSRDEQTYTVYRWPTTGTAGTDYPTGMAGYAIMTKDLSLGYVTGGSITKGKDLTLTTSDSAAAGTITARTSKSDWNTEDADSNLQYINGTGGNYASHGYYSYYAAQKVCPKGWRPPTSTEYSNIITFMGGNTEAGATKIRSTPYNFVYGGFFDSNGWGLIGSSGRYWSFAQNSSTNFGLYFSASDLYMGTPDKYVGRSVRCITN